MSAIQIINLSKSFNSKNLKNFVVKNINLEIASGEFFSLLGSSGCGKTTTLRMIAGFEAPSSGEIYIDGNLMGNSPPFKRPVNTVFQNYALFPHLCVADNIAFGLEMEAKKLSKAEIIKRVGEALEMTSLSGFQKRYPSQLSGGQQQRVALARSLAKKPKVLLLDEPLGALDLKLRKQMQLELKRLQKQTNITFVYVTHDQEEALTMSDRLGVMNQGELLQVGTPKDIYEFPSSTFVAEFMGENNVLQGRVIDSGAVLIHDSLLVKVDQALSITNQKEVTLMLRPEKANLFPDSYEDPSCWPGVVEDAVYLGGDTRYQVACCPLGSPFGIAPNLTLTIRHPNTTIKQYHIGEKVKVKVNPESFHLLDK